jgi:hypothetical protein
MPQILGVQSRRLTGGDAYRRCRWFEDHVHVAAAAAWAHQAAAQPAKRKAESLGPNQCLHVQFGRVVAPLELYGAFDCAPHTSRVDSPAQPVCLAEGFNCHENEKRTLCRFRQVGQIPGSHQCRELLEFFLRCFGRFVFRPGIRLRKKSLGRFRRSVPF